MAPVLPVGNDFVGNDSDEDVLRRNLGGGGDVIILVSDSSDDAADGPEHQGYQLLSSIDPAESFDSSLIEEENPVIENTDASSQLPPGIALVAETPLTVDDKSVESHSLKLEPEMDEERIEVIKTLMKSITLPQDNLPPWSSVVPEEEWKAALFEKIRSPSNDGEISKTGGGISQ